MLQKRRIARNPTAPYTYYILLILRTARDTNALSNQLLLRWFCVLGVTQSRTWCLSPDVIADPKRCCAFLDNNSNGL
eukprot:scaffold539101_cov20-Prasinocladus_malaysianus.AAC.1